jgi:hypothetical protein
VAAAIQQEANLLAVLALLLHRDMRHTLDGNLKLETKNKLTQKYEI